MKDKQTKYPQLRFKGCTDPWEKRRLGDISEKVTEKNSDNEFSETLTNSAEYGIISQRDFFDKDISNEKNLNTYYVVRDGDFVYNPRISNFAPVGPIKRNTLGRTGVMSPLYYIFRAHNVDGMYLEKYFSSTKWHRFMELNGDTGARADRFAIKDKDFVQMPIPLPNLEEQSKIARFLENVDNLIAANQRKLDLLKEQKKGYLQEMFPKNGAKVPELRFAGFADDWEERKLGAITDSFSGGTPTAGKAEYYGGEIPFIRSGEISSDSTELFITDAGLNNSSAKMVGIGDILYALYGATSGETSISRINGAINQAILAIRPTKGDDPYMIVQWLKKQKETIISTYLQGGQGNLSGSIVKDLLITLPKNKDEQAKVGSFFKQLDQTITLHQRKLEKLQELKKGYLKRCFADS